MDNYYDYRWFGADAKTNEECIEQDSRISTIVSILEHNSIIVKQIHGEQKFVITININNVPISMTFSCLRENIIEGICRKWAKGVDIEHAIHIFDIKPNIAGVLIREFTTDEEVIKYIIDVYNKNCM